MGSTRHRPVLAAFNAACVTTLLEPEQLASSLHAWQSALTTQFASLPHQTEAAP